MFFFLTKLAYMSFTSQLEKKSQNKEDKRRFCGYSGPTKIKLISKFRDFLGDIQGKWDFTGFLATQCAA